MKINKLSNKGLLGAVLLFVTVTAFAAAEEDSYLREAREFMEGGDLKSAVIQAKNALQQNPANVEARILLGTLYLKLGDGEGAEKELKRAAKLNLSRERWLKKLGDAYLLQRKFGSILEEIEVESSDPEALQGEILLLRGQAYVADKKLEEAEKSFVAAEGLLADSLPALIGRIQLALAQGKRDIAGSLLAKVLESQPGNSSALLIRGEMARQDRDLEQAEADFSKVLEINPDDIRARMARVYVFLATGKNDEAEADLKQLENVRAGYPIISYLKGLAEFQRQELEAAAETVEQALQAVPNHLPSQLLYGEINYAEGELQLADEYFTRALSAAPNYLPAVKKAAATRIKLGRVEQAIEILEPAREQHPEDPQLLAILGSAYLRAGRNTEGAELLDKAVEIEPDVAILRTQLALGLMAEGKTDEAISELKSAVDLGQGLLQADALLVLSLLKKQDYDKALEASAAMEKRMPDNPVAPNLTGLAYMAKKDEKMARESFNRALKIDPEFLTAKMNLARLELAAENGDAAKQHYNAILKQSENHLGALIGLAGLAGREGEREAALKWLERADKGNPENPRPGMLIARYYLDAGDSMKALQIANGLSTRFPSQPPILQLLGEVQMAAGETSGAIRSFDTLAQQLKDNPAAWYRLGAAQAAAEHASDARRSLKRALDIDPGFVQAKIVLANVELRAKNFDTVTRLAKEVQKSHPQLGAGYEVEGAVFLADKQVEKAIELYTQAYGKQPSGRVASLLSRQHFSVGNKIKAEETLRDWLSENPEDVAILSQLGAMAQSAGRDEVAVEAYEKVLKLTPKNMAILNNLAWLYHKKGDRRALGLAKQALDLAPDRPEVVDTYGWILLEFGSVQEALTVLKQAMVTAPTNMEIAYHVGYALHKAGQDDEARKVLKRILKQDNKSPVDAEVRALLEKLE